MDTPEDPDQLFFSVACEVARNGGPCSPLPPMGGPRSPHCPSPGITTFLEKDGHHLEQLLFMLCPSCAMHLGRPTHRV
eukprot:177919-Chlamydomonas_euryale.AAC.4